MLPEGGTMELIAPHVPRPLQREFRQRYDENFGWEIVDEQPGQCTVQVTKRDADAKAAAGSDADAEASTGHGSAGCGHHAEHDHGNAAHGGTADADAGGADEADLDLTVTEELDVRDRPPAQRHQAIFEAYADLAGGEGFVLVNDHDPKPLYHQFDAEAGPEFRWEYQQKAPGEFRVLVGKADGAAEEDVEADGDAEATDGRAETADDGAEAPF